MFLGLDVPDDFSKPRGRTLSNKTTIIVKVPSEPFMRLCDIEHVEPVQDLGLGDVQKNLQYLKRHPDHGSEFLSHLWGLKFGGMVATSPLSAYLDLKHDREGIAGATSAFGEVLSKINQGDYFENRGSGMKILNMESAGMFEEMNQEAREQHQREAAHLARLKRCGGMDSANPYLVNIRF